LRHFCFVLLRFVLFCFASVRFVYFDFSSIIQIFLHFPFTFNLDPLKQNIIFQNLHLPFPFISQTFFIHFDKLIPKSTINFLLNQAWMFRWFPTFRASHWMSVKIEGTLGLLMRHRNHPERNKTKQKYHRTELNPHLMRARHLFWPAYSWDFHWVNISVLFD
jgi:hypothetical protein